MNNILPIELHNQFEHLDIDSLNHIEQNHLIALALSVLSKRNEPGQPFNSAKNTCEYLQLLLGECANEEFGVLFLDNKHRLIKQKSIFFGTIDGTSVYSRVIIEQVIRYKAAAVIFYHNHPSGGVEPSREDQAITQRLKSGLELIDVRVLDHFIVGSQDYYAFSENDLI